MKQKSKTEAYCKKNAKTFFAPREFRSLDLSTNSRMLYQLSYHGSYVFEMMILYKSFCSA